jgi:uncharacterized membrane protein (DUF2068 family)
VPHAPHSVGLRTVAIIEASKGILVLLVGFGLLALLHKNIDAVAQRLTRILHMNPQDRLSHVFLQVANRTSDKTLWVLALGALVYAIVRFVEAFGLWRGRDWAQWFALLSGAIYLPGELYSLMRHPHPLKWAVLAVNSLVVLYMLFLRLQAKRQLRTL